MDKAFWEKGSLRASKGFLSPWFLKTIRPEDVPAAVKESVDIHSNVVQVYGFPIGEGCGTDISYPVFASQVLPNQNPDLLKVFVEEYHKAGIRVNVYFNGHSYVKDAAYGKHKDWVMMTEDGEELLSVYTTGMSACPNNPNHRKFQMDMIGEWANYDIDGVFLDGDIFFAKTCFCKYCKALFQKQYPGMEMPKKSDRRHPNWRHLKKFQEDSIASYLTDLRSALKAKRPNAMFYYNAGLRGPNWTTGRNNRRIIPLIDVLLSESGFVYGDFNQTPFWRTECENKLCMSTGEGKPVFSGMAVAHKNWSYFAMSPKELEMMSYAAVATGAFASAAFASSQNDVSKAKQAVGKVFGWIQENENWLYPVKNAAKTAIVWSYNNADYYEGGGVIYTDFTDTAVKVSDVGNLNDEFLGLYDACFRTHELLDVIDETHMQDGSLSRYGTVILPNIACMNEAQMDGVRKFVQNGGTLIATFETSLFNEYGEKRETFGLADLFGVEGAPRLVKCDTHNYVAPMPQNKLPLPHLKGCAYLPAPYYSLFTKTTTATPLINFKEIMEGRYDHVRPTTDHGYLLYNTYGKGRVFYFTGTLGHAVKTYHHPETLETLKYIFRLQNTQEARLLNEAYQSVSLNLMQHRETGHYMLYLVNYTGTMTRPLTEIVPLYDLKIQLYFTPKDVRPLMGRHPITVEKNQAGALLHISCLEEFEAVALTV